MVNVSSCWSAARRTEVIFIGASGVDLFSAAAFGGVVKKSRYLFKARAWSTGYVLFKTAV